MRLALAAALCLAAGCAGPGVIKAYPGAERGSDEVGTIVTAMRHGEFSITDNQITGVDGMRFEKPGYTAQVLPGARRVGLQGTLRADKILVQRCSFELNVEPACTYRPIIPAYPRPAGLKEVEKPWRSTRAMTVIAECADTSYAVELPLECSGGP